MKARSGNSEPSGPPWTFISETTESEEATAKDAQKLIAGKVKKGYKAPD